MDVPHYNKYSDLWELVLNIFSGLKVSLQESVITSSSKGHANAGSLYSNSKIYIWTNSINYTLQEVQRSNVTLTLGSIYKQKGTNGNHNRGNCHCTERETEIVFNSGGVMTHCAL